MEHGQLHSAPIPPRFARPPKNGLAVRSSSGDWMLIHPNYNREEIELFMMNDKGELLDYGSPIDRFRGGNFGAWLGQYGIDETTSAFDDQGMLAWAIFDLGLGCVPKP